MKKILFAMAAAAAMLQGTPTMAQEVLRAIHALPENNDTTRKFRQFIDIVNRNGEGVVQIEIIGGPESIPSNQQDTALRNGVVDMQEGPSGYYFGVVPEGNALQGATITSQEARENGAFEILNDAWRDRLGAELIGWIGAETKYYIYLREDPVLTEDGGVDFSGLKFRSVGTYRDWFTSLGVENIMMPQPEVFSALERGIIDGFGWISIVTDVGVNRLISARVGPPVWRANTVIMMNGDRYDALSDEAKTILAEAAIELENSISETMPDLVAADEAQQAEAGVEFVTIEGEAGEAYVRQAHDLVWDALEAASPEFTAEIKPLMYPQPE
ncbi:hypothetical protein [Arenibacterium sp. LLYu02]|uniref:hypothetical protein n=1 Tax=Arenibacterium sp. LLYu02 TaxID=3404132 RepID=UPI003B2233CA